MSIRRGCCCGCYSLTHCDTAAVTYTRTDMSAYIGRAVNVGGECYTVAESEDCISPSEVVVGSDHADCGACYPVIPCTDCDPRVGFDGEAPNNAAVAGAVDNNVPGWPCEIDGVGPLPYTNFTNNISTCIWTWEVVAGASSVVFTLTYAKSATTVTGSCPNVPLVAGEYLAILDDTTPGVSFWEKTAGFSCDPATGKISGTHTFNGVPCTFLFDACGGNITVTVLP